MNSVRRMHREASRLLARNATEHMLLYGLANTALKDHERLVALAVDLLAALDAGGGAADQRRALHDFLVEHTGAKAAFDVMKT